MIDLYSEIVVKPGFAPAIPTDNTAQVSNIIDLATYAACVFTIHTGTLADSDATFDVLLQEGDAADLSDAAEVDATNRIGLVDFNYSKDNKVFRIGYRGAKRYVRLTVTPSGNTGAAPLECAVILVPKKQPEAQA